MKTAETIHAELAWLEKLIQARMELYFGQPSPYKSISEVTPPQLKKASNSYSMFVAEHNLDIPGRVLLILSLAPLLRPNLFDFFMMQNSNTGQRFVEFGGIKGTQFSGLLPTLDTLLFLLAGEDLSLRLQYLTQFSSSHPLFRQSFLSVDAPPAHEPFTSSVISPSPELIALILSGKKNEPGYSTSFPAKKITTRQSWSDLVLEDTVLKQIEEIQAWVRHGHILHTELGLGSKLTPGHRCLFYGPPGTGKTLTATLIGKQTGLDVYRIDLSQVVSKYIGETEKNLSKVFDRAESRNWILFFDEADALFGRRTSVKDAHDRFANQEVSYLLQRVEEYNGLVILATNFKSNIDEAFARRFQSVIHFPMPQALQRKKLWANMLPDKLEPDANVDISALAEQYELSGGSIINIVRYSALMALTRNTRKIILSDIMEGIKREFIKEGKAM